MMYMFGYSKTGHRARALAGRDVRQSWAFASYPRQLSRSRATVPPVVQFEITVVGRFAQG